MKKNKKKIKTGLISSIAFSLITLFALTVAIVFLLINYSLNDKIAALVDENTALRINNSKYIYTQKDLDEKEEEFRANYRNTEKDDLLNLIKQMMNEGKSAYSMLRTIFPNHIVVVGNDSNYEFFDINDSLKKNYYDLDKFIEDETTKEITYSELSDDIVSYKGIDVSSFNGKIDWKKVKSSGVDFAYIRVGYRGNTEGGISLDGTFTNNIKGAQAAGIDVGVYFYTQAINEEEAREEAKFVIDAVKDYKIQYPIAFDLEEYKGGRADGLSVEEYTGISKAFLEEIEKSGYKGMLYGNLRTFFLMADISEFEDYEKWFAYYANPVYYPYDYAIWQYRSDGKVDGIKGDVDMNICLKRFN